MTALAPIEDRLFAEAEARGLEAEARRSAKEAADAIQLAIDGLNAELRRAHHEGFTLLWDTRGLVPMPSGCLRLRLDVAVMGGGA